MTRLCDLVHIATIFSAQRSVLSLFLDLDGLGLTLLCRLIRPSAVSCIIGVWEVLVRA